MTDDFEFEEFEDYLDANIYMPLLDLIKKLEERILAMELQQKSGVVYTAEFTPADSYYWEHG